MKIEDNIISEICFKSILDRNSNSRTLEKINADVEKLLGNTNKQIVDAGIKNPSQAAQVMELGVDAVLMNTAVACAKNPILMASAMKHAIEAGNEAYEAGRIMKKRVGEASSPKDGVITDD